MSPLDSSSTTNTSSSSSMRLRDDFAERVFDRGARSLSLGEVVKDGERG